MHYACAILSSVACPAVQYFSVLAHNRGTAVARWFDPSWCHWNFSLTETPSDRTMALGSIQPLIQMSTRSVSWGKGGRCVRLTTLPPSCAVVTKSGNLNFLEPSGPVQACNGTALPLSLLAHKRYDFRKSVIEYKMCVLNFSKTFVWIISHSNKK